MISLVSYSLDCLTWYLSLISMFSKQKQGRAKAHYIKPGLFALTMAEAGK